METKDNLSSCSDLDEQEIQQLQKQAKILKENSLNTFNALKTTTQHLERHTFTNCPSFQQAFAHLFHTDVRTFKYELSQDMNNLEKQLNNKILHEKDSKSALSVMKVQFDKFIHFDVLKPFDPYSSSASYDREVRKNFKDYTQIEAQTFKETIIQNMNSIEQCIVERARHEQQLQNGLKRLNERKLQIQECKVQEVKALDASSGDKDFTTAGTRVKTTRRNYYSQYKEVTAAQVELLEAIEKRFSGNAATKKTQKNLLKQQFENFSASSSEMLDQTFDRLQKNKADLDTISMDDLYNNLKVYEPEFKGISSSNSNTHNMAFLSFTNKSTNRVVNTAQPVNTANGVSTTSTQVNVAFYTNIDNLSDPITCAFLASQPNSPQLAYKDLEQIHPDDIEEMDLRWQMAMLTMRARRFLKKTRRKLTVNGNETLGFDMSKVKCYNCHKRGHFARECRARRNQDTYHKESTRRSVPIETLASTALVSCDGLGAYDCSDQAEEEPNYALMAYTSSSFDPKLSTDSTCLKSVEERLEFFKENEFIYLEDIKVLKVKIQMKEISITKLRRKHEVAKKQKDGIQLTVEKLENAYKSLNKLIDCQIVDNCKKCLGYESYNTVSPPNTGNFMPPKPNLSYTSLDEFAVKPIVKNNSSETMKKLMEDMLLLEITPNEGKSQEKVPLELLIDESQVLLRVPRKNNMYSVDLKNIVSKGGLTYLFAKATSDEFKLWRRRLEHLNFKIMNKLVKRNLVRGTKNETSGILKSFITRIENLVDHKVKVIRCDNGTEFKNREMNQFCEMKEAVNNACYVKNRVLVVKPHNMTPYELSHGRTSTLNFMRPFGCLVTILNTLDHFSKFDGKVDEGSGPDWLFDINALTKTMNYEPIVEGTQSNGFAEKEDNINNTNNVNTVSSTLNVAGTNKDNELPFDPNMPALEDVGTFDLSNEDKDDGEMADTNNLETIIQEELLQFKLQEVWTLVDLSNGKKAIGTKWVFRNKKDARRIVIRNKARLVAQCHTKQEGIDYDEVFSPVTRIKAIRLFLAYASFKDFMVYQLDVKVLFSMGKLKKRCMYVNHQDLKIQTFWIEYTKLKKHFIDYIKLQELGDILLVQVYVDDIIFGSTRKELCNAFEKLMHEKFQMSFMGELTFFLELQVKLKNDGIFISQDKFVAEILKKFRFTEVKNASTPIETQNPLLKDKDGEEVDVHMYRYQVNQKVSHLHAVKRIFRYLKGHLKLGLSYPKDSPFNLVAYTNSDYAGASLDRKSTTGGITCYCWFNVNADEEKSTESEGFEQIVYFLSAHTLRYALTDNPTIYDSCIEQFWSTAMAKTINEESQIHARVGGKEIIITESSVRRDLQLADEDGVDCLPNSTIFENLKLMATRVESSEDACLGDQEDASKQGRMIEDLDANEGVALVDETQGRNDHDMFDTSIFDDEEEVVEKDVSTANPVTTADKGKDKMIEPEKLLKRKDQIMIDEEVYRNLQAQMQAELEEEERLARQKEKEANITLEDASKQGRIIDNLDVDEEVTMVDEAQGRNDQDMFDTGKEVFVDKEVTDKEVNDEVQKVVEEVVKDINTVKLIIDAAQVNVVSEVNVASIATTDSDAVTITIDEVTLAKALAELKALKPKTCKRKTQKELEANIALIETWDDVQAKIDDDYQMAARLQVEEQQELTDEEKATLFMQFLEKKVLCSKERKKLKDLKNKSFDSIQKMFDKSFNKVNTFVDFKTELDEGGSKRAGEDLTQERSKKQKVDDDKETAELKKLMEIIPNEEEIAIDAISLDVKSPNIVDWKIHKEEKNSYYQIIRADGNSKMYMVFNKMLKDFDREDLEDLYSLVKAKYGSTRPVEDLDFLLWGDLKTMFKPHVEDQVWKNQHGYKVIEWKLYDSCRVLTTGGTRVKTVRENYYCQYKEVIAAQVEDCIKGNDQGLDNQRNTSGDESTRSRNECNDKSISRDDADIRPSYDTEPTVKVPYTAEYNVFAIDTQHSEQPEYIINTCLVEKADSNVIPDSPDMCDNKIQTDQNIQKQLKKANTSLAHEFIECKFILKETSRTLGESNSIMDSYLISLQNKQTEFERYKTLNDRTVNYEKLKHKLNETLGLLAQKEIDIKECLKLKACEILVVKEKHDELVKQSLLTKSHYEGLIKEKPKVITDLKLKEEKDIDKMI
nr:putative ribonuclease H-like domain-containing protein [Tanacetum cinerariifolium]